MSSSTNKKSFRLTILTLFFLLFIDGMSQGIVFPLLADSLLHGHSNFHYVNATNGNLYYGLMIGTFFLCWFFGAPLLSDYSDMAGRKKVLLICLFGSFLGFLFTALGFLWHSVVLLFLGRIVNGITAGSQPIATATIVDVCPKEKKTRYFGFILLAVCIGIVLGPVLGALFSNPHISLSFNNETPMYIAMGLSLINLILLFKYFTETNKNTKKQKLKISKSITIFISAFKDRNIRVLSFIFLLVQMGWSMFYFYNNSLLIARFHYRGSLIALYIAALGVGITIGFTFLVRKFESCKKKYSVIIGYGVIGIATVISIIAKQPIYFWLAVIPAGAGLGLGYANILAIFSSEAPSERQGWVMGITSSMMAASSAVMALSIGPLTRAGLIIPFIVSGTLLLLGLLIFIFDRKIKH